MRMLIAIGVLGCGATLSVAALAQNAASLSGAYVGPGQSCEEMFVTRNGKTNFKEPRNAFSSAILIRASTVSTPMATCRIGRSASQNGVVTLNLNCTNAMSSHGLKAYFRRQDNGSLARLSGPSETSGDTYQRCSF